MMAEPVWSVSEVNRAVRDLIEGSLHPFWIKGEVSNLLPHRSGHAYLSLKTNIARSGRPISAAHRRYAV